ncbi:MAG: transposase [Bacteroidales bacterium]|nr:transposase [Bacteroidales bacterium]
MLQNKDIAKIQEIKTLFQASWTQPEFFSKHLELFKFSKSSRLFQSVKGSGVPFWEIMRILLVLPFMDIKNVGSLFSNVVIPNSKGQKDVYYRALANQKINWRNLLLLFVKRYLQLDQKFTAPKDNVKCLIFDDTDIEKRGKKIEGISKIHNHVTKHFIFGYKLLVAGYWNGSVFIPVDFSFHRENKENKIKKYGLSKKELKKQKRGLRNDKSPVHKRFKELNSKKTDIVIQMFRRINQRKISVDYILFDSWFTSMSLIKKFLSINKNVNIIGMYKYNSKLIVEGKELSIKQLRKQSTKVKRSRSMKLYYHQYIAEIDGVKVSVFITKRGTNGAWHTIISTNINLSFVKTIEIYNIRWTIEVFFKEAKQLLGLGKSQSTNFDVQVAQTTVTMIQYLLVSLKYRMEAYETIGGMFKNIKQDYIEHNLNERLLLAIVEILSVLELIIGTIDFEETVSKLLLYSDSLSFFNDKKNPLNLTKLAA